MSKTWIALLAAAALGLAACGAGNDRTKAKFRLVNASSYTALDLRVEDGLRQGAVGYGRTADYIDVAPAEADTAITVAGSATSLLAFTPLLEKDRYFTVLAYGGEGALKQLLLPDNTQEPASGRALLRVVNAAPDVGLLDIYITATADPLASAVPLQAGAAVGVVSSWITVNSGTWRLRVTAGSNKQDVRIDLPALTLPSRDVSTLVLTPGRGGVLVNALMLAQQGPITAHAAAQARVRVAAGAADGGSVAASVGGTTLMNNVGSPAVGLYTLLPAGTQPVLLTVNGAAITMPDKILDAGADYTLLVHGTPAAARGNWIEDDNTLPASPGQAKLRLVHGVADLAATLAMTVDFVPVADGVASGRASTPALVTATTTARLSVTGAGLATPLYSAVEQHLDAGANYSVFVVGTSLAPVGILRKDR